MDFENYDDYMEMTKFVERDFQGEDRESVDSKIKLSYIEYNPKVS